MAGVYATGTDVGVKLCEALRINPAFTKGLRVVIDCQANAVVSVEVTRLVSQEEFDAITKAVEGCEPVIVEKTVSPSGEEFVKDSRVSGEAPEPSSHD